jgi:hypothetical protein
MIMTIYSMLLRRCSLPVFLLAAVISGCSTTPSPRYYLLTPATGSVADQQSGTEKARLHIIIGPVKLPEYLARSQIVMRRNDAEIALDDRHRWAEALEDNFARVLAENLYNLLGSASVAVYPSRQLPQTDYRVTVDVLQFDANDKGEVRLIANWSILDADTNEIIRSKRADHKLDMQIVTGYTGIVGALSTTINLLSREIYDTVSSIQSAFN